MRESLKELLRHSKLPFVYVAVVLITGAFGVALIEMKAREDRRDTEASTLALTRWGAAAAAAQVQRALDVVDLIHDTIADAALAGASGAIQPSQRIRSSLMQIGAEGRFGVQQVTISNADGAVVWSSTDAFYSSAAQPTLSIADRDYFRVHRDGHAGMFISTPETDAVSGQRSIQVSRPLSAPYAPFAGVVVVSIDPGRLSQILAGGRRLPTATATLLRSDGTIIARTRDPERYVGVVLPDQDRQPALHSSRGSASFLGRIDGNPFYFAWEHLQDRPLIVTFRIEAGPVLAALTQARNEHLAFLGALLLIMSSAFVGAALLAERRRVGEKLRLASEAARLAEQWREETSALLEGLPGAAYRGLADDAGHFECLMMSRSLARMTGWPIEDFGKPEFYAARLDTNGDMARRRFFLDVREHGRAVLEYRVRRPDGRWIWLRDECSATSTLSDGQVELVGMINDITTERTLREKAIASSRLASLGEMATGVAHEINQPAATIMLASDIALMELEKRPSEASTQMRNQLEVILTQTARIRTIIDQFRSFSREESGAPSPVDLSAVVEGALLVAGGTLQADRIIVDVSMPPGLPAVSALQIPLEQTLVSLLLNARDAMIDLAPEQRRIEIQALGDANAEEVCLVIGDHGPGMAEDELERAFEPFRTTKAVGDGMGLGLSIAHATISRFGGRIELENRPGIAGLNVRIWLHVWKASPW